MLPRTLIAEDGRQLRVLPKAIEGYVESCTARGAYALCTGWSADVERRRPADTIAVLGGGGLHRYRLKPHSRPDVAGHFGAPELEAVGFELELPLEWFRKQAVPRFFGVVGDRAAELEYLSDRSLR